MTGKVYKRALTESGDYYNGTEERWKEYREAVKNNDLSKWLRFEEGFVEDFYYDP
jgi:hypothetical protein